MKRQQSTSRRENSHLHLYSTAWKKLRAIILREQPLCVDCLRLGILTTGTVVDHIKAHKGDMELFYARDNLQVLCASCHNRKTAREDQGFGNRGKAKASKACRADGLPVDPNHPWNR